MTRREYVAGWASHFAWYATWRRESDALMARMQQGMITREQFLKMVWD